MKEKSNSSLVSEEEILLAYDVVKNHPLYVRTPLLQCVQDMFPPLKNKLQLYLKLENMQTTGSFKIRGMAALMKKYEESGMFETKKIPITMSSGNFGKAFATYLHNRGLAGKCILPDTAPRNRSMLIQDLGVETEIVPKPEMRPTVDKYVAAGTHVFFDSINSRELIAGYASIGIEILEELPAPDIVLVCCGTGGLVSGVATAIKYLGNKQCRIYAVEPEGAPCMSESYKTGRAVSYPVNSVAAGLAAPYVGEIPYRHCKEFVEGSLLVSDAEILQCVELLYRRGLVVEPSGAAAMAALLYGHVPNVEGKKVCAVITGGNVTPEEMVTYHSDNVHKLNAKDWKEY